MPHDEQDYEYHMTESMIEHFDLWIDNQVPGILPWHLLAAQCRWESSFNPHAVSSAGAKGIAQFMPDTWREIGHGDPFNARESVRAQSKYMLYLAMLHADTGKTTPWWWIVSYTWGFSRSQRCRSLEDVSLKVQKHAQRVLDTSAYYWRVLSYPSDPDR